MTASFRYPLVVSGTQITTPVPSYSTILGMISACAGRIIKPEETRIGFEFHSRSRNLELERKDRMVLKGKKLQPFRDKKAPKDYRLHLKTEQERVCGFLEEVHQGIGPREVYWRPRLDLYLTNVNLKSAFENPASTPCFGRSQDIGWISFIREIDLIPKSGGKLGPTLIPMSQKPFPIPSLIVRLPEYMENARMGYVREPGPFGIYQAMNPTVDWRFEVTGENFYHPSDAESECTDDVIYLHQWLND
jgi:CRISPR-associated protein Cas5t